MKPTPTPPTDEEKHNPDNLVAMLEYRGWRLAKSATVGKMVRYKWRVTAKKDTMKLVGHGETREQALLYLTRLVNEVDA